MTEHCIYPLTFEPVLRDYIWGGRNLETLFDRQLPPGIVAESWDISGHPSAPTRVDRGPLAGWTLPEVQAHLGHSLVGTRSRWATRRHRFPLLIKLLDANRPLSVQVHPDDAYAQVHEHGELGKTELWYVLHAKPGARLIYGLSRPTTREGFRAALEGGTLSDMLHYLPVQSGDSIYVPAGTLHALLEGIIVAEVQQNSDTTYRVYDWDRVGADGRPRPLHVDKALDVIDYGQVQPGAYAPVLLSDRGGVRRVEIGRCPYFATEEVKLEAGARYEGHCDGSTLEIWGCISGQANVQWAQESLSLPGIRFCLLPATLGHFAVHAERGATLLRIYAPE
jgi:mannose-6-phosphate isomerase